MGLMSTAEDWGLGNFTPLMYAALNGHHQIAKLLMQNKAQLNLQDDNGHTTLMLATASGHTSLVAELIERGADRDIENQDNETPLHWAQEEGHHDIVTILDRGQIQADEDAAKAVLAATEAGCPNVVSDLLQRVANMDTKTKLVKGPFKLRPDFPKQEKRNLRNILSKSKNRKSSNQLKQ